MWKVDVGPLATKMGRRCPFIKKTGQHIQIVAPVEIPEWVLEELMELDSKKYAPHFPNQTGLMVVVTQNKDDEVTKAAFSKWRKEQERRGLYPSTYYRFDVFVDKK